MSCTSTVWSYNKSFHNFNTVYFKKTRGVLALSLVYGRFYLTAVLSYLRRLAYL